MPYDPSLPINNAKVVAAILRGQFNGLKTLIDGVPGITAVVIDSLTTGNPGDAASGTVALVGSTLHFTFSIPRGDEGLPGTDGLQGPPFAQLIIDAVNTLDPGVNATVDQNFDGTDVHLTFGIPRGTDGTNGTDGATGEVTTVQLTTAIGSAISGTSNNTNAVATLDTPFADPEADSMRQRFNELVLALRRA